MPLKKLLAQKFQGQVHNVRPHSMEGASFSLTAYDGKKIQLRVDVGAYPRSKAQGFSVDDIQLITEPKA